MSIRTVLLFAACALPALATPLETAREATAALAAPGIRIVSATDAQGTSGWFLVDEGRGCSVSLAGDTSAALALAARPLVDRSPFCLDGRAWPEWRLYALERSVEAQLTSRAVPRLSTALGNLGLFALTLAVATDAAEGPMLQLAGVASISAVSEVAALALADARSAHAVSSAGFFGALSLLSFVPTLHPESFIGDLRSAWPTHVLGVGFALQAATELAYLYWEDRPSFPHLSERLRMLKGRAASPPDARELDAIAADLQRSAPSRWLLSLPVLGTSAVALASAWAHDDPLAATFAGGTLAIALTACALLPSPGPVSLGDATLTFAPNGIAGSF